MSPSTILAFLFANRKQVKKVVNKRYRKKIFKTLAFAAIPVAGLYIFAPSTFNTILNVGKNNIPQVLGIGIKSDPKKETDKFNNSKNINTKVLIGNIQWTVLESSVPAKEAYVNINADYCIPQSGNKFIKIKYKIDNLDRSLLTIPKFTVSIFDSEKNEYTYSQKTFTCILKITNSVNKLTPDFLKRGESKTYELLFEVPESKKDFKMKVGDLSVTSSDYEYIKLGI